MALATKNTDILSVNNPLFGNYAAGKRYLSAVMANSSTAADFIANGAVLQLIYGYGWDNPYMTNRMKRHCIELVGIIEYFGCGGMAVTKWLNDFFTWTYANVTAIAASSTAMTAIAASSTAMTAIIASSTALSAVVNSSTAMTAIAASSTAMTAIMESTTSQNSIAASALAMNVIIKNTTAKVRSDFLAFVVAYSTTLATTLNNSAYFTVTNYAPTSTGGSQPYQLSVGIIGFAYAKTYQINNYGGSASDTTGTINHGASTSVAVTTFNPGTGNQTLTLNKMAIGGLYITGAGSYPGKVNYGTWSYTTYVAI